MVKERVTYYTDEQQATWYLDENSEMGDITRQMREEEVSIVSAG